MGVLHRPVRAGAIAVMAVALTAMTGVLTSGAAVASAPASRPRFAAINGSLTPTTDTATGSYHSARMSLEEALPPRHQAALNQTLKAGYTSPSEKDRHGV